jgi:hypothetical protein
MILSPNEIAHVAVSAGWRGADVPIAVAVALAESNGNAEALGRVLGTATKPASGNYDHGLWQISSLWHGAELQAIGHAWRDPYRNAEAAHAVWLAAGGKWSPWSTFTGGAYLPLLPFGTKAALFPWPPPTYEPTPPTVHLVGTITGSVDLSG